MAVASAGTPAAPPSHRLRQLLQEVDPRPLKGRVTKVVGTIIHAAAPEVRLGELYQLRDPASGCLLLAEAVGLIGETAILTPLGDLHGLSTRTEVVPLARRFEVAVGPELLGRVVNGLGLPLDEADKGPLTTVATRPVEAPPPPALARRLIERPLPLHQRALDGLLTTGEGQRVGIYGAPGVGKSTLLAEIVKAAEADVAVFALIGERGRELREFLERQLGEAGRKRAVVVAATADRAAMERVKAAYVATAIAEYFREQGQRVVLLIDSVTRFARAQREIGLAAGEPPTRRGFPPSVFAALPRLMERAGCGTTGSITAFYAVLVEGELAADPIAEEVKGILDGHIVLSDQLAARGHFPAIDVLASQSRLMPAVVEPAQLAAAQRVRALLARHAEIELLLQVGEYQAGSDPEADQAIARLPAIRAFLQQTGPGGSFAETVAALKERVA